MLNLAKNTPGERAYRQTGRRRAIYGVLIASLVVLFLRQLVEKGAGNSLQVSPSAGAQQLEQTRNETDILEENRVVAHYSTKEGLGGSLVPPEFCEGVGTDAYCLVPYVGTYLRKLTIVLRTRATTAAGTTISGTMWRQMGINRSKHSGYAIKQLEKAAFQLLGHVGAAWSPAICPPIWQQSNWGASPGVCWGGEVRWAEHPTFKQYHPAENRIILAMGQPEHVEEGADVHVVLVMGPGYDPLDLSGRQLARIYVALERYAPTAAAELIHVYLHTPYAIKPSNPPPGLALLAAYLRCITPHPLTILNTEGRPRMAPLSPAIVIPMVPLPVSEAAQALNDNSQDGPMQLPLKMAQCLRSSAEEYSAQLVHQGPGINQVKVAGELEAFDASARAAQERGGGAEDARGLVASGERFASPRLVVVVHNSQFAKARRMWNAASVLSALRAAYPVASGVHVVAWDASLVAARDLPLMGRLYSRAHVVVTGAGLAYVHHALLQPGAAVVDVETAGVAWEDVDMRGRIDPLFKSRLLPYQRLLLRAGVLPMRGPVLGDVDYPTLRFNSDYRVNVRAAVRAVGVALMRSCSRDTVPEFQQVPPLPQRSTEPPQTAPPGPSEDATRQDVDVDEQAARQLLLSSGGVDGGECGHVDAPFRYRVVSGTHVTAEVTGNVRWGPPHDIRLGPLPRDTDGQPLTDAQRAEIAAACDGRCSGLAASQIQAQQRLFGIGKLIGVGSAARSRRKLAAAHVLGDRWTRGRQAHRLNGDWLRSAGGRSGAGSVLHETGQASTEKNHKGATSRRLLGHVRPGTVSDDISDRRADGFGDGAGGYVGQGRKLLGGTQSESGGQTGGGGWGEEHGKAIMGIAGGQYLPNQLADRLLGEEKYVPTSQYTTNKMSEYWGIFSDNPWRQYVARLAEWEVDPAVLAVLRHLFPPSSHACHGRDEATRTCHYTNLVAHQAKFYYVTDTPNTSDPRALFVWPSIEAGQTASFALENVVQVTYAQLFGVLTRHLWGSLQEPTNGRRRDLRSLRTQQQQTQQQSKQQLFQQASSQKIQRQQAGQSSQQQTWGQQGSPSGEHGSLGVRAQRAGDSARQPSVRGRGTQGQQVVKEGGSQREQHELQLTRLQRGRGAVHHPPGRLRRLLGHKLDQNPPPGMLTQQQQFALLGLLLADLEVADLPRAVVSYPQNVINFYHFAAEVLATVHYLLCHGLGTCRYWGEEGLRGATGARQQEAGEAASGVEQGAARGLWERAEGATWDDPVWDPSRNVARDPTDYYVIMWGTTARRWQAHHDPNGREGRAGRSLPIAFELLRCYHPQGGLWMTQDPPRNPSFAAGLRHEPPVAFPIGRPVDVASELAAAGLEVPGTQDVATRKLLFRWHKAHGTSLFGHPARLGLDEGLGAWRPGHVFRIGHTVAGMGPYKRYSYQYQDREFTRIKPFPPALQQGWKRRMLACLGHDWEDSLRPELEPLMATAHNRKNASREFVGIDQQLETMQQRFQGLVTFKVAISDASPLPQQALPFLTSSMTMMSHSGGLGHFIFPPMLSAWVDVTYGRKQLHRRFIKDFAGEMYTWKVPVIQYQADTIQEFEFIDDYDRETLPMIQYARRKQGDAKQVLNKLKHAESYEHLEALCKRFGLGGMIHRQLFLMGTRFKLNTEKLGDRISDALRQVVTRLAADIVNGNIVLHDPGKFIQLLQLVMNG